MVNEEFVNADSNRMRIQDLALATLSGKYGVGQERKKALAEDYDAVMAVVQNIRKGEAKTDDPLDPDHQEITDEEIEAVAREDILTESANNQGTEGYKE